jgi:hypothetical protein
MYAMGRGWGASNARLGLSKLIMVKPPAPLRLWTPMIFSSDFQISYTTKDALLPQICSFSVIDAFAKLCELK